MNTNETIALEDAYQLPTYKKMPVAVARGEGCYVWDVEGRRFLDFYGGHCVTALGHCPEKVVAAVQQQAATLMFYSNAVYSPVRAQAAASLSALVPDGLGHVFFCNSGTEANETALKLARKWTGNAGLVAMVGGFHGRTLGSLAATWNPRYRTPHKAVLPHTHFVPFGDLEDVESVLFSRDDIAAVILEPIQSMAGVLEAPPEYFRGLRALCDRRGVALIFDEIQTGVGRTGTFLMAEHFGVLPDLITLAKSLGSGVPVGAVLSSDAIAETVEFGDQGSTFGGGMLAMAAVEATLETLREDNLMEQARTIYDRIRGALAPRVAEVRGRGCLIGLELEEEAAPVLAALREHGVLAGSAGHPNVIRLMPPLNTPPEAVDAFIQAFEQALKDVEAKALEQIHSNT